jgi:hypothetical protein
MARDVASLAFSALNCRINAVFDYVIKIMINGDVAYHTSTLKHV